MFGLLLKDFYQMKKQFRILLFLAVIYGIISVLTENSASFVGVSIMMCIMLPLSSFSFDQYAKWDNYALTLPVTRKQIIAAKFLLGYGSLAVCLLLSVIIQLLTVASAGNDTFEGHFFQFLGGIAAASSILISITLPLVVKLGVEKSRFALIAICLLPTLLILAAAKIHIPLPNSNTLIHLAKLSPIAGIAVAVGSYILTVRWYEKKEF